jgi:hypothetical protein
MTVAELIERLLSCPPDADVQTSFDVSDHDTFWRVYDVQQPEDDVVVLKAT